MIKINLSAQKLWSLVLKELHPVIYYRTISTEKLQIEISLCDKHATSCAAELYHTGKAAMFLKRCF